MILFVLFYDKGGYDILVDIYASRKKAEKQIAEYTEWDRPYLWIEEKVLH